jgi:outer membrane protein assembly factor BamB
MSELYLDGKTLYIAIQGDTQQVAYALRASDGQQLWQATSNAYSGTPFLTASDGMAYIAIEDTTTFQTTLEARNSSNGNVLWSRQYPGEISFATVANHILYVYAFPGAIPSGDTKLNKRLMAFQAKSGAPIWSRDVHYGNYTTNITYMQNTLIVDDHQQLCVHSASNGSLLWCISEPSSKPDKNTITQSGIGSYLAGNDRLYVAYVIEKDTLLSPTEVATICKQQSACINSSQGHMFNTQITLQLKALDYQNGQTLWTSKTMPLHTPILFLALNLVQLQQNTLLVGGSSPLITTLDASNGQTLWHINGSAQPEILQMAATS